MIKDQKKVHSNGNKIVAKLFDVHKNKRNNALKDKNLKPLNLDPDKT